MNVAGLWDYYGCWHAVQTSALRMSTSGAHFLSCHYGCG